MLIIKGTMKKINTVHHSKFHLSFKSTIPMNCYGLTLLFYQALQAFDIGGLWSNYTKGIHHRQHHLVSLEKSNHRIARTLETLDEATCANLIGLRGVR